jgi:nicotinamide N-methyltransferase
MSETSRSGFTTRPLDTRKLPARPPEGRGTGYGEGAEEELVRKPVVLSLADGSVRLMAHYVWQSAITLAEEMTFGRVDVKGKVVVELGAGAGLPGIVASRVGAKSVVISDYPEDCIVENMEKNLRSNQLESDVPAVIKGFAWGTPIDALVGAIPVCSNQSQGFDVVLMADTLWVESQHHNLLRSLQDMCVQSNNKDFRVISTYMNHDTNSTVANAFFALATESFPFRIELSRVIAWKKNEFGEDEYESDSSDPDKYGPVYMKILAPTSEMWVSDAKPSS